MRRILVTLTAAAMMVATMALSGVALAQPIGDSADAQCLKLAIQTLGPSYNPANYTFIGGTEGIDDFIGEATEGPDVFCGFGNNDHIGTLNEGDIFLGGAGNEFVHFNYGTFYGEEGLDIVFDNYGIFYGEEGNDQFFLNASTFVQ